MGSNITALFSWRFDFGPLLSYHGRIPNFNRKRLDLFWSSICKKTWARDEQPNERIKITNILTIFRLYNSNNASISFRVWIQLQIYPRNWWASLFKLVRKLPMQLPLWDREIRCKIRYNKLMEQTGKIERHISKPILHSPKQNTINPGRKLKKHEILEITFLTTHLTI